MNKQKEKMDPKALKKKVGFCLESTKGIWNNYF